MLNHDSIENHIMVNFNMVQHHNYSLSDLEAMLPWERSVYVEALSKYIEDENRRLKELENKK